MRVLHFETLRPICPACRFAGRESPLALAPGARIVDGDVRAGILRCTAAECGQAYPVIAGAPVLMPDLAGWLASNLPLVLQGDLDTEELENLVGAAVGPDAAFNVIRQQQASYAYDHYGDLFAPDEAGSIRRGLAVASARLPATQGPVLDIGCAAGRTTLDMAASDAFPVLGIDVNWPLLKIGRGVIDDGVVLFPHRRVGVRYERRRVAAEFAGRERADFWIADALALPFPAGVFGRVVAMNVLDCVADPAALMREVERALGPEGQLVVATPYDWASHATPAAAWLVDGEAVAGVVDLANRAGGKPESAWLRAVGREELEWDVRLHDRATVRYRSELMLFSRHWNERVRNESNT
ncbi:methyltransferase domain-containing protein [Pseudochelatococcus contaminans]|nr:methyltransferase domain-containing protein [Pseudochelatococcus contaminans]